MLAVLAKYLAIELVECKAFQNLGPIEEGLSQNILSSEHIKIKQIKSNPLTLYPPIFDRPLLPQCSGLQWSIN